MVHSSVFNGMARVFTPRYRQMSAWGFFADPQRKQQALNIAYGDVQRSFQHFLQTLQGKPFILAGHSQGTMLLCRLLKEDPDFNKHAFLLVAAYLVAADIGPGDCGNVVRDCELPTQTGCLVHFNVMEEAPHGNRAKFFLASRDKNLTCVNPITFRMDQAQALPTQNPGSRPFLRVSQVVWNLLERFVMRQVPSLNFMSPLEPGVIGARCEDGMVWINPVQTTGYWTTGVFPGGNLHGGESSLFYLAIRQNVQQRIQAFQAQNGA